MQEMQSVTQFVSRLRLTRREVTMELILDTQPYMLYETSHVAMVRWWVFSRSKRAFLGAGIDLVINENIGRGGQSSSW